MANPSAVPTTRTVNGKALAKNVTLAASDVGALAKPTTPSSTQMVVLNSDGTTSTQAIPSGGTGSGTPSTVSTSDINKAMGL